MKRILALTLAVLMLAMCFVACGKTEPTETPDNTDTETPDNTGDNTSDTTDDTTDDNAGENTGDNTDDTTGDNTQTTEPAYKSALELLTIIYNGYNATATEETMLYVAGGNSFNFDTVSFEGPGKFVPLAGEEYSDDYSQNLGIPEADVAKLDDAASMFNMMNANMFTSYAVHFANAADVDTMVETLKTSILARHWICGSPDKLIIAKAPGNYLIVTWGVSVDGGIVLPYTESFATLVPGSEIVVTENIG